MNYKLIQAKSKDIEILYQITQTAMKEPLENLTASHLQNYKDEFLPLIDQTWLIIVDGKPSGRLRINKSAESIHIGGIQILPDFQNKGIGSDILDKLIAESKTSLKKLTLQVHKNNGKALNFYSAKGFKIVGENEKQYSMEIKNN